MLSCILSFFAIWPILDVVLALYWFFEVKRPWHKHSISPEEADLDERQLGASVILAQLNGIIMGASILIVGIGVFVALADKEFLIFEGYISIIYAAGATFISLGLALYAMSTLPSRTPKYNFVKSPQVAILSAMSLFFVLLAVARFFTAIVVLMSGKEW